jgi:hypothetical protein
MRNSFIGYYPRTEDELKLLWERGIIVLDTNVLLNLYRYSKESRKSLLDLLEAFEDQLWLPHHVALEYHRNRLPRIYDERDNCRSIVTEFNKLLKHLDESRRHPFVSAQFRKKLDDVVKELEGEIQSSAEELDSFKTRDPILEQITSLYDGRVGASPDNATLDAWLAEGEERYRQGIPPGFEDRKKKDDLCD